MNHVKVRDFSQTFYWFLFFTESSFFCTMQETAQRPPGQCIPQHECLHGDEVWGAAAVLTFSPSEQHFVDEWYEALPTVSKLNSRLSGATYDTFTECLMVGYWEVMTPQMSTKKWPLFCAVSLLEYLIMMNQVSHCKGAAFQWNLHELHRGCLWRWLRGDD